MSSSVNVLGILQKYLNSTSTAIDITPAISSDFGNAIGQVVSGIFSGSISVDGANFTLTGNDVTATITGTGSAAPLVSQFTVTFVFTEVNNAISMALTGTITSDIPISSAWPAVLSGYPFNSLTLTSGSASLTVSPTDSTFELVISATISFENSPLGTGLLEVTYENSTLGFLGGFIVTSGAGSWTPATDLPVIGTLTVSGGEFGAFFSTITAKDLSAFDPLKLPYLPDEIDPGLTVIAAITLGGSLAPIASILPQNTELQLLANVPPAGLSEASITASLTGTPTTNSFQISTLELEWQSTSSAAGTITLTVAVVFNDGSNQVDLSGQVAFTYGDNPALEGDITVSGSGPWTHPFGIQNLTVLDFSLGFSIADETINLAVAGDIEIGAVGSSGAVTLDVGGGIADFEVPDFIFATLSPAHQGATVTLAQLITDFIPTLDLTKVPLLNSISFQELSFYAVAIQTLIEGKQYYPGVGATGIISFFGYQLDFAFSLVTSPSVAVKAKGSISYNGGPIVISVGGLTVLTLSDSTGKLGPSACVDTTGSGFCPGSTGAGNYFTINAAGNLLGLASASVVAQASSSSFELDMALDALGVFTEKIHVELEPSTNDFAASVSTGFHPPNITLGPWGVIPQFTIPTPQIDLCCALGTIMPKAAPCADSGMPGSAPYFQLDLAFSWGPLDFSFNLSLDFASLSNAFSDFGAFVLNLVLTSPKLILDVFLSSAAQLAKLLLYLGQEILALAEWVFDKVASTIAAVFELAYEAAFSIVQDAFNALEQCAQDVANSALGSPTGAALMRVPAVEVDLLKTPGGQSLLYHYYMHRDELHRILRSETVAGAAARAAFHGHETHPARGEGRHHIPVLLAVIQESAPVASPEFQASAVEVVAVLEAHRGKNYDEFIIALG